MHLSEERRCELLQKLAAAEGFDTADALIQFAMKDSVCPAICRVCEATCQNMERDQTRGWCESCRANTVVAAPVLAGII